MSEEEKKAIEITQEHLTEMLERYEMYNDQLEVRCHYRNGDIKIILNLIEKQQKELNNLKEIEKSHQEENGKLRVELEQEKEKNKEIAIKNRALKEESNACGEQIVSLDNQLKAKEQEIAYLKSQIPSDKIFYFSDKDYISKDKIMQEIKNIEKRMETATNSTEYQKLHCAQEYLRGLLWEV